MLWLSAVLAVTLRNGFSSLQLFIVVVDVTLGVMMIAFGMTVIVIVRVLMVGLATPHNQHGCDDCDTSM